LQGRYASVQMMLRRDCSTVAATAQEEQPKWQQEAPQQYPEKPLHDWLCRGFCSPLGAPFSTDFSEGGMPKDGEKTNSVKLRE
jgi:hypothetical protein